MKTSFSDLMGELLLSENYVREVFSEFGNLTFFDAGLKRKRVNLEVLVKGIKRIVEEKGAVITNPTITMIDRAFYYGGGKARKLLQDKLVEGRVKLVEEGKVQKQSLMTALEKAFGLSEDWEARIQQEFNPYRSLGNSEVLYQEEAKMWEYLRNIFQYSGEIRNQRIKYYSPVFLLGF